MRGIRQEAEGGREMTGIDGMCGDDYRERAERLEGAIREALDVEWEGYMMPGRRNDRAVGTMRAVLKRSLEEGG
jgi:hypothetical protein